MYSNKESKNKSKINSKIIVTLAVAIVLLLTLFVLERTGVTNFYTSTTTDPSTPVTENKINLEPPTETEKKAGNNQKEEIVGEQTQQKPQDSDSVNVIVVDSSQYNSEIEVRAFASNIVQDGTCKITFTKDTASFSKEVPAKADASTTPCLTLNVPRSEFNSAGTWEVTIEYIGASATGSATSTLEVI